MEPSESDLEHQVVQFRPPEEILWLSPPKAQKLNAFLKNQYKGSVVEVKTNKQTNFCHQRHKIVISDIHNHFPLLQITLDRANCMLLSFLSQIQSVPKDYSITYIRRWMAIHMANNVDYLWVIIFTFNTFTTCIFLEKPQKTETSNLYATFFHWKSLNYSLHEKQVFSLKSLTYYTIRFSLKTIAQ